MWEYTSHNSYATSFGFFFMLQPRNFCMVSQNSDYDSNNPRAGERTTRKTMRGDRIRSRRDATEVDGVTLILRLSAHLTPAVRAAGKATRT